MAGAISILKINFLNFKQLLAGTEVKKIIVGKSRELELLKNSKFENLELLNFFENS